jgi:SpoVK/Ycf46/Vps4 family AAA+-type ATPase
MKPVQWAGHEDNAWQPVPTTTPNLKPNIYVPRHSMFGWNLVPIDPKHDRIIRLGVADYVFDNIKKFWSMKETFGKLGLLHKRGFLLHGPPGTGKSIALILVCRSIVESGGVALLCQKPELVADILKSIRAIHPDLPIVCAWEDIEQFCDGEDFEYRAIMTSLLDGEIQIDNVVHVATTNHLDKIDPAFANRPGRFDDVIYVGAPDKDVRMSYLKAIIPNGDVELMKELVTKSDGLLLSHLKDTVVSVFALGHSVDNTIARLKTMADVSKHIEEEKKARAAASQTVAIGGLSKLLQRR